MSAEATSAAREPLAIPRSTTKDGLEVFDCPMFYAFGAGYPDGTCHDGHICDADSDHCTEESNGHIPCPACCNDEYQTYLAEGGDIMYPYGFDVTHPDDYFMPRIGIDAWRVARDGDGCDEA